MPAARAKATGGRAPGRASRALRAIGWMLLGGLFVVAAGIAYSVRSLPELSVWHRAQLDAEFRAGDGGSFTDYLAREERLFAELDAEVYERVPTGPDQALNRYSRGSLADPSRWPEAWNRSFELRAERPRAAVLLLHGLSDSPYSLRALGERLHAAGAHVVGLRIPGHGTAPSGLLRVRWQDMAEAVAIAARHTFDRAGRSPVYLVGYSNGGALAVEYALASLSDATLPRPDGLVLLSPEIGVSRLAALAIWQERIGRALGLEALAWTDVAPEYDPFKYNSFATNAGDLAYRITAHIQRQLAALTAEQLAAVPPVLAFQSAVDATVTAPDLVAHLFARLPPGGHELVLYDVNRQAGIGPLLAGDPQDVFGPMLDHPDLGFDLTVITNASAASLEVVAKHRRHGSHPTPATPLGVAWPPGVYSLSHIALPFPPDDPLYGGPDAAPSPGLQLGDVSLRGERGVLQVPGGDLLRLHWNPFFDDLTRRVLDFLALAE